MSSIAVELVAILDLIDCVKKSVVVVFYCERQCCILSDRFASLEALLKCSQNNTDKLNANKSIILRIKALLLVAHELIKRFTDQNWIYSSFASPSDIDRLSKLNQELFEILVDTQFSLGINTDLTLKEVDMSCAANQDFEELLNQVRSLLNIYGKNSSDLSSLHDTSESTTSKAVVMQKVNSALQVLRYLFISIKMTV